MHKGRWGSVCFLLGGIKNDPCLLHEDGRKKPKMQELISEESLESLVYVVFLFL